VFSLPRNFLESLTAFQCESVHLRWLWLNSLNLYPGRFSAICFFL
jgi:hypothetical protein